MFTKNRVHRSPRHHPKGSLRTPLQFSISLFDQSLGLWLGYSRAVLLVVHSSNQPTNQALVVVHSSSSSPNKKKPTLRKHILSSSPPSTFVYASTTFTFTNSSSNPWRASPPSPSRPATHPTSPAYPPTLEPHPNNPSVHFALLWTMEILLMAIIPPKVH